ncbi:YbhB/YbcL family Raf kinase inhibitor-like protein [Terriglobus albidus]|uniref:YbhB/YbcL family Raf kinase inhibitor-like protein n=1 Tax=Terriglobus albidus TaxID=1592106 RepID=A0A5B9E9P4_9BACT|nr:YbhB/YbcL family Raf kinase inhibitor-like protein [Terriglobus albidus]QEE28943.1 YbhB/YbcL family Raf kinase inhibitor-like protein [Terriglobus albidus]
MNIIKLLHHNISSYRNRRSSSRVKSFPYATVLLLCVPNGVIAQTTSAAPSTRSTPTLNQLVLTSPAFSDNGMIPDKYASATATNTLSPPLEWKGVPEGTASFVLMVIDEEFALQKKTVPFYHWIIFNIPGTATGLPEGVPAEKQLVTGAVQPFNFRWVGYLGPGAPAAGQPHHYIFRLMALDVKLTVDSNASAADIMKEMDGHILDRALLVGRYKKPK